MTAMPVLHARLEAQADLTPDAIAVVCEARQLTYRELEVRANQLAHRLRSLGVRPDDRVALCLERSLEMVVAMFGILKAGAAYVPLDPETPAERVRHMVEAAQARVAVTRSRHCHVLPSAILDSSNIIYLDRDCEALDRERGDRLAITIDTDHLAYVIFTSGSSGRPKGSLVTHGSVCNVVDWLQQRFPLTSADAIVQRIPFSFDGSVCDFHWPWLAGARLVLLSPASYRDPGQVAQVIADQRATTLVVVPTMLAMLLDHDDAPARLRTLRRIFCGGETLAPALVDRVRACLGRDVELVNLYGPTETTVFVTAWPCRGDAETGRVPIGHAIARTTVHVVDDALRPVAAGDAGEIVVAGAGLARGYAGQPGLTAERFVPDPFGAAGARLYRTGDRGRWSGDGALEHLGRGDDQIKLRGHRIEPGDVEAALRAQPGVRDAVVVVREDRPGAPRLVGYVVAAAGAAIAPDDLRGALHRVLPPAFVPDAICVLAALPLTARGKIDRSALPAVAARRTTTRVAPQTSLEHVLALVVRDVAGHVDVGRDDSWFELGLDSVALVRIAHEVRKVLGVALRVDLLFAHTTIAAIAAALAPDPAGRDQLEREAELVLQLASLPDDELQALIAQRAE